MLSRCEVLPALCPGRPGFSCVGNHGARGDNRSIPSPPPKKCGIFRGVPKPIHCYALGLHCHKITALHTALSSSPKSPSLPPNLSQFCPSLPLNTVLVRLLFFPSLPPILLTLSPPLPPNLAVLYPSILSILSSSFPFLFFLVGYLSQKPKRGYVHKVSLTFPSAQQCPVLVVGVAIYR